MTSLLDLPSELLEHLIAPLALPLHGCHSDKRDPLSQSQIDLDAYRDLLALSATCRELHALCRPFALRTVELASSGRACPLDPAGLSHVRSLVIGYPKAVRIEDDERDAARANYLTRLLAPQSLVASLARGIPFRGQRDDDDQDAPVRDGDDAEADIVERQNFAVEHALPRLRRLHLHDFVCFPQTWQNLATAPCLESLIIDDDVTIDGPMREPANYPMLRHLMLDLPSARGLPSNLNKLDAVWRIIASSSVFEWLCVRTFKATFGTNTRPSFDQSLWRTLRSLHLDAGHGTAGFDGVFEGFRDYRKESRDELPLAEVALETRSSTRTTFEHILHCLSGHRPLRKLSLCVIPYVDPNFIRFIAACAPDLTDLHLVAFHGNSACRWVGGTLDEYAGALQAFKRLETFGWNGIEGMAILQSPAAPAKGIDTLVHWTRFGETDYNGTKWTRIDGEGTVFASRSNAATFFPLAPPALAA